VSKRHGGFTLIELLVVIVIIGILVAIALPNFLKIKEKAKEAETKQNLHSIQLSLERYSTDNEGLYPYYLYGGDAFFNIGTMFKFHGKYYGGWGNGVNPFDTFVYTQKVGNDNDFYGDTLIFEGYMTKYPRNPFTGDAKAMMYGRPGASMAMPYSYTGNGGESGKLMMCMDPYGEGVMLNDVLQTTNTEVELEYPGNFWYHPRFGDGGTNGEHQLKQFQDTGVGYGYVTASLGGQVDTQYDLYSDDVVGYDLGATGSAGNKALDVDIDTPNKPWNNPYELDHALRTGYLINGQERNPFNATNDYDPITQGDGWGDFYIIFLNGGLDTKPGGQGEANG